ncbi:MAG: hypothetical protein K9H65_01115, partial [Bacteroidales bacterium]|nr:hypothetical protein [Bacteroidales bacterium]
MNQLAKILTTTMALLICLSHPGQAQWSKEKRDSLNKLSRQDHQLMMKKLGITELRPGPSGDPDAPNAANSDESKAKTYDRLPDPLTFDDGTPVATPAEWQKRRQEIIEHFNSEVYGRVPENTPSVTWEVKNQKDTVNGGHPVTIKDLVGHVDNSSYPEISVDIEMTLATPANINKPVPVIVEFGWNFPGNWSRRKPKEPTWKQQLLEKGWGYAILVPTSYQADHGAGLREGII